jgi:DMSO reductase family type II enzyme heme b subunit
MDQAATTLAELSVARPHGWQVRLRWRAPHPVESLEGDPSRFVDACAILTGETPDAPWMTMGAPGQAVSGALWKADRGLPYHIRAEGLGTVERTLPVEKWSVMAVWANGAWDVTFDLAAWPALDRSRKIALAIWQGAAQQRAGLKSVSTDWIPVTV